MKSDSLQVGNFTFKWGSKTYVMGILNITPDSFSGDGLIPPLPSGEGRGEGKSPALEQAKQFLKNGADILDIGGESTRPGSQPVTAEEELARVIPVIQDIRKNFPDALISIDTSKADVAEAGFKAGANILNDVWALRADPRLASVAAAFRVPVILMHNHPGGDPSPSTADLRTTRDLIRAGQLLRIEVLDHVIIGQSAPDRARHYSSLKELGHFYA